MSKVEGYRDQLLGMPEVDWPDFLLNHSSLPGPRGNLELAYAVMEAGSHALFERLLASEAAKAPENTPGVFLAFCGLLGLGKMAAEGRSEVIERLRAYANDPRWRVREAVAIALQRLGKADLPAMLAVCEKWRRGSWLEMRAVVAGIAEPALLRTPEYALRILNLFDQITVSLESASDRREESYKILRQALGYAWSVVVAAFPDQGLPRLERWMSSSDPDVLWVLRENLKKKRLIRLSPVWVATWVKRLNH
jgi:hypothetical protein